MLIMECEGEGSHRQWDRTGLIDLEQLESETRKMESQIRRILYLPKYSAKQLRTMQSTGQ